MKVSDIGVEESEKDVVLAVWE